MQFRVVSGPTGSAKSRVAGSPRRAGAQILHLEELAAHKGSVLGNLPDEAQPSQKMFETRLHSACQRSIRTTGVRRGREPAHRHRADCRTPWSTAIRAAPCVRIEASRAARVDFLLRDYAYFLERPNWLAERLGRLRGLQSNETLAHWLSMIEQQEFRTLVAELLEKHYDPLYQRSQTKNYADYGDAHRRHRRPIAGRHQEAGGGDSGSGELRRRQAQMR